VGFSPTLSLDATPLLKHLELLVCNSDARLAKQCPLLTRGVSECSLGGEFRRFTFFLPLGRVFAILGVGCSLSSCLMTERDFTVRQATVADLDALVPLFDAYRQFYRKPTDPGLARRFLLERLANNESILFLAEQKDGPAAGFTQLYPSFSSASAARILILNDLFVTPAGRRARVGTLLLAAAARFGEAAGAVRLTLSTEITNKSAQTLYERQGWTRDTDFYLYTLELGSWKSESS
jgi:ribosomal protein S18 acetylase RimI-like enzyme